MSPRDSRRLGRRTFLKSAGSASGAAVAAAAIPTAIPEAHAYDPGKEETKARYQADSPGVQAFYRTNGYETLKKK